MALVSALRWIVGHGIGLVGGLVFVAGLLAVDIGGALQGITMMVVGHSLTLDL